MHRWPALARIPVAFLLIAHGIAHLVGARAMLGLADPNDPEIQLPDPALGWITEGAVGTVMGILWILACLAFAVVGVQLWRARDVTRACWIVTLFSLALCLLVWPGAPIGVAVNVAILVVLAVAATRRSAA